jgi:hypothetical protein
VTREAIDLTSCRHTARQADSTAGDPDSVTTDASTVSFLAQAITIAVYRPFFGATTAAAGAERHRQ